MKKPNLIDAAVRQAIERRDPPFHRDIVTCPDVQAFVDQVAETALPPEERGSAFWRLLRARYILKETGIVYRPQNAGQSRYGVWLLREPWRYSFISYDDLDWACDAQN